MDPDPQESTNGYQNRPRGEEKVTWVYWTVIGVSLALAIIIAFSLYELLYRRRVKLRNQEVQDGGPPATPTHSFSYVVGVRANKASPNFDNQLGIIKVELFDHLNRYVTSIAVPCFLLKFQLDEGPPPEKPDKLVHPVFIRSMTVLREQWVGTNQTELLVFNLTRRKPLNDVASARVTHDCYAKGAYITLKYVVFHDPLANVDYMVNLKDQQIKAVHPCPPSGSMLVPVEKFVTTNDELKSFLALADESNIPWCPQPWCPQQWYPQQWFANCWGKGPQAVDV